MNFHERNNVPLKPIKVVNFLIILVTTNCWRMTCFMQLDFQPTFAIYVIINMDMTYDAPDR